jgi:hypothetical protein
VKRVIDVEVLVMAGLWYQSSLLLPRRLPVNNPLGKVNRDHRLWELPENNLGLGNGNPPTLRTTPGKPSPSVRKQLKELKEKPCFANDLIDLVDSNYSAYVREKSPTTAPLPERFPVEDYTIDEFVTRITNPLTDRVDSQSVDEALTLYQAKHEKIMIKPSRPTKTEA